MPTDYERIRRSCKKRSELWEDPDFPALQSSVFYHQTPPFQFTWKRPKELSARPGFIQDGSVAFDVDPGKMGDRWLVACLGVLHMNKGLFYRVVPADQSFSNDQYVGIFRFRLWWCGKWTEVLVDDRLPTVHGRLAFLQCQQSDHFWPALLEKAYAKLHGSYEALKYGCLLDGLADLTGGITESIPLTSKLQCVRTVQRLLEMTSIVTCSIQSSSNHQINHSTSNNTSSTVINQHSNKTTTNGGSTTTTLRGSPVDTYPHTTATLNYQIERIERIEKHFDTVISNNDNDDDATLQTNIGKYIVKLNLPTDKSDDLVLVPGNYQLSTHDLERWKIKNHNQIMASDGREMWISFSNLTKVFNSLHVIHLDADTSRDEPNLQHPVRQSWQMRLFQTKWQKGISSGGCRNHPDTFHINPQFQLVLLEDVNVISHHHHQQQQQQQQQQQEIIVSLNQHSIMEPKVIGFTAYALPITSTVVKSSSAATLDGGVSCVSRVFFKKHKSLFNSQYTNSRQVSHRVHLEAPGNYLVVPTTFEPGQEASFTLRIYSNRPLKLKTLDTVCCLNKSPIVKAPPLLDGGNNKGFSQYEAVFLQLADEHRTVNAFELQELLDACLPNDYIKSCASIDVCRQVVFTFDANSNTIATPVTAQTQFGACSGRLKFVDFKDLMCSLKCWQTAFKQHTKEKAGILRAERLRDALLDVGFQLSNDVLATLILRFMRKDGTLRFGDFVSAILHLSNAYSIFVRRNSVQNGVIKINLSDWLKSSLSC